MLDQPELSPFAEELIPEAFARPHTAYRVHRVDPLSGERGFAQFIESLLRYTLTYRCDCGIFPARIVVVEGSDGVAWYWEDDEGWPVEWTVERVRREARPIPEPWLFAIELLRPDEPAAVFWEEQPDGDLLRLPNPSWQDLSWIAVWYAEARGRGMAETQAGVVHLERVPHEDRDQVVAQTPIAPAQDPMTRDFHRILYAHPARKQHPLRRDRRRP